ncbi:MAG: ATP-binding protein [Bradymonadales bacterium]|nr:MAG: ATP-binding protein [Bradymonadales bacterium]
MNRVQFGRAWTSSESGLDIQSVEVQAMIRKGLPRFDLIGLPEHMIREGKDRIFSSLHALQIELPPQRILVHLMPGDQPKEGSHFDLPILVALFEAMGLLPTQEPKSYYWGELQLDGSLREFPQALRHLFAVNQKSAKGYTLQPPEDWDEEAEAFLDAPLLAIDHIEDLFQTPSESSKAKPSPSEASIKAMALKELKSKLSANSNCLWNQLKGSPEQFLVWALSILGREHLLLMGPAGQGKSLWSKASKILLPPLPPQSWKERLRFLRGSQNGMSWRELSETPFESPHHKASASAVIGGGSRYIQEGAITRAHRGVLFLDELLEFHRDVLESLREPLEEKSLRIARSRGSWELPADIQLIAATNPCPCGSYRSKRQCLCTTRDFYRYQAKLSGPLTDRFHRKLWWEFQDQERPQGFSAQELALKIFEARDRRLPKTENLLWPKLPNARQSRLYLEKWKTWLRWFSPSIGTEADFRKFLSFETQWERAWEGGKMT